MLKVKGQTSNAMPMVILSFKHYYFQCFDYILLIKVLLKVPPLSLYNNNHNSDINNNNNINSDIVASVEHVRCLENVDFKKNIVNEPTWYTSVRHNKIRMIGLPI